MGFDWRAILLRKVGKEWVASFLPLLSPKRRSPNVTSASRPVARFVTCIAPLILTNFAGEPSGKRSFSFAFWCEMDCRAPRQPAMHSRSIIQSFT